MRIGFLTNEYPFDKLSQISSFYQWLQAKKIDVIVIACDKDNFNYDKKSKVIFFALVVSTVCVRSVCVNIFDVSKGEFFE